MHGNWSKAPDKRPPGQKLPRQKPSDNNPPWIIGDIIVKYAVDANLFRLGSTNPIKKIQPLVFLGFFFGLIYRGLIVGGLLSG